jgi:hypothetical protein
MSDGIWYPSRNHVNGWCDVDRAWLKPDHLKALLKQFPDQQTDSKTIRIPEEVHFETDTAYENLIFKGGIPFHGVISKTILRELKNVLVLHRRKVT